MLFQFLKYISPTWYFNLQPKRGFTGFYNFDLLPEETKTIIDLDMGFFSSYSFKLDAAYQAWHKGVITNNAATLSFQSSNCPSIEENYRFIRKYFHPLWSYYILLLRLLTFHNPIREVAAFLRQSGTRRVRLYDRIYPHEAPFREFESPLLKQAPKVSVIIPTLNRYQYLSDALHDLELQDYPNFEVIVIDQSEPFDPDFYKSFKLSLRVIRQAEKALWLARNTAIKASSSDWIALSEDDVRIPDDWLSNHLKCIDFFNVDISAGVFFPAGTKIPANRAFFRWADQFATGNACLKKEVFKKIGLFDRQFERQRMGDGEFGLRAYLAGYKSVSNPYAWCEDVKAPEGGLRQMGSWDAFRPKSWLAPRPVPSVNYFVRKYFGDKAAVLNLLVNVPLSVVPYRFKRNNEMLMIGAIIAIITSPFWLIQVIRSWHISSRMLRQGALIDEL